MHARVTIVEGTPEQLDAGAERIRGAVLPAARELEGFCGVLGLADRTAGKAMTITFWESEGALTESEEAANRLRQDLLDAMAAALVGVERYEVTISELPTVAGV